MEKPLWEGSVPIAYDFGFVSLEVARKGAGEDN